MNWLIRQAQVLDPTSNLDATMDVYIEQGHIKQIVTKVDAATLDASVEIIQGQGKILTLGFTDLLTYLRQLGNNQKSTIATETKAAASAGFVNLLASPDTEPAIDTNALIRLLKDQAQQASYCAVYPVAAMTQGLQSSHLTNMHSLSSGGAVAFSNAGYDITNNTILLRCYEYAATFGLKVFIQAWDQTLSAGHMHEGALATRLGLDGIPVIAETMAISRHLQILEHTGMSAHFQQISSAKGVGLIRQAKQAGINITADVDLAHLCFTEQQLQGYASEFYVQPPLRSEADRQALLQGIADGTLDAITSAHQPHKAAAKQAPLGDTALGMAMYDNFVPLLLSLQGQQGLTISQLIKAVTNQPAQIAGTCINNLAIGHAANLCLIDPKLQWQLNPETQQSQGANQALGGENMQGRVVFTLKDGVCTWGNGII